MYIIGLCKRCYVCLIVIELTAEYRFEQDVLSLINDLHGLKRRLGFWASNAKTLAIIQECPCYKRTSYELSTSKKYNPIDSLYTKKHDYAKAKIMDRLLQTFGGCITVKSEHDLGTGAIDILVQTSEVKNSSRKPAVIGIEIKAGMNVDVFEIERYLLVCDYMLLVRIPTRQVELFDRATLMPVLYQDLLLYQTKMLRLIAGNREEVECTMCRGCRVAECRFKKPQWNNKDNIASLDFGKFKQDLEVSMGSLLVCLYSLIV